MKHLKIHRREKMFRKGHIQVGQFCYYIVKFNVFLNIKIKLMEVQFQRQSYFPLSLYIEIFMFIKFIIKKEI